MVQAITTHKKRWAAMLIGMIMVTAPWQATAAEQDPALEEQFKEGMKALEEERLKSAIRAFTSILEVQPELHRAKLELALAYYRSTRYAEAERLAKEVLDDPLTPPEVRVTILAFLAQVKRDSEYFGQRHKWKPFIGAGIMRDSNVNVGPTSDQIRVGDLDLILVPGATGKSDNAWVYNAGADYLYQSGKRVDIGERTGMLVWQAGASLYRREYNTYSDFDLGVASISGGPAVLMLRHWRAALNFQSDYLTLGGAALGWFNSVNPSITWQFDNGELGWDAIYTRRNYHRDVDSGREGDYAATGVALGRYLNNRKLVATAGARIIKFFADDDQYGYIGGQLNAGFNADTWPNGNAYMRARVSSYNYDGDDSLFGKSREEKELRTTIGITHEYAEPDDLLKDWVVSAFWERTYNNSNIGELYTYKRYQMMLMLSRSF